MLPVARSKQIGIEGLVAMNPEEAQRLEACVQEIAAILYKNTPLEALTSLEGIEKAVRQHMLEQVSPEVSIFLSNKLREQRQANLDKSAVASGS